MQAWAEAVADQQVDTDSRVAAARRNAEQTYREQRRLTERHLHEPQSVYSMIRNPSSLKIVICLFWSSQSVRLSRDQLPSSRS